MFQYESDRPRCWRPDLVPAILAWVDQLTPESVREFLGFTVGLRGEFGAEFLVRPSRGGPCRQVRHKFDHTFHDITTDAGVFHADGGPQPFTRDQLTCAADKI